MPDIWFADCEVYEYDLIWVFTNKRSGETFVSHNDTYEVEDFLEMHDDIWLCGYNFNGYDQYILKGTLLHYSNEELHTLSNIIVNGTLQSVWNYLGKDAWSVSIPPFIDLIHDIVPRKSLKEVEANKGLSVRETPVPFDIERPLTQDELKLCIEYCKYDVFATGELYKDRLAYLKTKKTLCERAGLNTGAMMRFTNARVVSEALHGRRVDDPIAEWGNEYYSDVIPACIDLNQIPTEVLTYLMPLCTQLIIDKEEEKGVTFDLFGTPTTVGTGGIHASTGYFYEHTFKSGPRKGKTEKKVKFTPKLFEPDDDHVLIIQDVDGFYPNMMILFGYMSRAIEDGYEYIFEDTVQGRNEAKPLIKELIIKGLKKEAASLKENLTSDKLVCNTKYGAMGDQYNKLYDPFMRLCVCMTGQLLIIDLMNRINENLKDRGLDRLWEIVQLNTDGWVLYLHKDALQVVTDVVKYWMEDTGLNVETDTISKLWQRDVNNYVMEFEDGSIKAKGKEVKMWKGGTFESNNMTIIQTAIVNNLMYDKAVEDTINECKDIGAFQVVLKAGSTFTFCGKGVNDNEGKVSYVEPIYGKVHRVYAVQDGYTLFKCKDKDTKSKFPDAPDSCKLDYEMSSTSIDAVDKQWYIDLAFKKLAKFKGE